MLTNILLGVAIFLLVEVLFVLLWMRRNDGQIILEIGPDGQRVMSLELKDGPEALLDKKRVVFHVAGYSHNHAK